MNLTTGRGYMDTKQLHDWAIEFGYQPQKPETPWRIGYVWATAAMQDEVWMAKHGLDFLYSALADDATTDKLVGRIVTSELSLQSVGGGAARDSKPLIAALAMAATGDLTRVGEALMDLLRDEISSLTCEHQDVWWEDVHNYYSDMFNVEMGVTV